MKIAILIPLCSRNQTYKRLEDAPFIKIFLPHLTRTKEAGYTYKLFVGYDDDDAFYLKHHDALSSLKDVDVSVLSNCQHHPTRAWNMLFQKAVNQNFDYFFQVGDDVSMQTPGWTTRFVDKLLSQNNIGTVGPCEPSNYFGRLQACKAIVIENNFVHKTHHDIFGYFFPDKIKNWYCDDWITFVYADLATMETSILCSNTVKGLRYDISSCDMIDDYVAEGKLTLERYRGDKKRLSNTLSNITFNDPYHIIFSNQESLFPSGPSKRI